MLTVWFGKYVIYTDHFQIILMNLLPNASGMALMSFSLKQFIPVTSNDERTKIINDKTPCCIISSSGMLTGGPSSLYAEKLAEDEKLFYLHNRLSG